MAKASQKQKYTPIIALSLSRSVEKFCSDHNGNRMSREQLGSAKFGRAAQYCLTFVARTRSFSSCTHDVLSAAVSQLPTFFANCLARGQSKAPIKYRQLRKAGIPQPPQRKQTVGKREKRLNLFSSILADVEEPSFLLHPLSSRCCRWRQNNDNFVPKLASSISFYLVDFFLRNVESKSVFTHEERRSCMCSICNTRSILYLLRMHK
jgi:hypothetical protein